MIIACTSHGGRLAEPSDFDKFKLLLKGQAAARSATTRGITFVDVNNVLVPINLAPTLPGRPDDRTWDAAYADMVAKARQMDRSTRIEPAMGFHFVGMARSQFHGRNS